MNSTIVVDMNVESERWPGQRGPLCGTHNRILPVRIMIHGLHIARLQYSVHLRKVLLCKCLRPTVSASYRISSRSHERHTVSLLVLLIVFPISLLAHSDLLPIDELIPGTTRGMMNYVRFSTLSIRTQRKWQGASRIYKPLMT